MAQFQTKKQLISDIQDNIYSNPATLINGDMDSDLRQDGVYSFVGTDAMTKLIREYNSNWTYKGETWVGLATPSSPTIYDCYMIVEAGVCFGISGCQKYELLVYSGVTWVRNAVDLNDYYYTKTEVDALLAAISGGGTTVTGVKVTGITISPSTSTTITHNVGFADHLIQIYDANGVDYTTSFKIIARSTNTTRIQNNSSITFSNMKAIVIGF